MRIIFYSSYVEFCIKLIEYIKVNSLEDYFKIVNIDDLSERETKELGLTIIPTLIDSDIDTPFEGTKAWEYVRNQKYFNHPTNNVEYTKNGIPKPVIDEDTKANISKSGSGFIYVDQEVEKKFIDKDDKHNFDRVFEIKDNSNNKVINTITNLIDAKRKFISYKRNILKNEVINYITKNPPTKNKSYYGYVGSLGEYWVHENFYEIKIKDITKNDIFYENINNLGYIYIYDIDGNIVYKNSPKNEKIIEKKEEVLNN